MSEEAHFLETGEYVVLSSEEQEEEGVSIASIVWRYVGYLGASTNDDCPVVKGLPEGIISFICWVLCWLWRLD